MSAPFAMRSTMTGLRGCDPSRFGRHHHPLRGWHTTGGCGTFHSNTIRTLRQHFNEI
jgi:hypothetical protein